MQKALNFIEEFVETDLKNGKHGGKVLTRFPPEPNGYLHIGHAKSICLNFGIAEKYGGKTNLRFDDTNPSTESVEYVESIKKDVLWLGFDWEDREYYASDYFDKLYEFAIVLIKKGLAYVDDLPSDTIAEMRGSTSVPGKESPYRNREIKENLDLFDKMRNGDFPDGSKVLRAKIDMQSPNMHMRDPVMYRIKKEAHHRTGDAWCIYPMYDFAHGQSDSIEGITHSLCTLEFENHRPLYDWYIKELEIFPSRQIEFARLNVSYMITSKRKLLTLVQEGHVHGWDDPRMPTIAGMRRRGYSPAAIRNFCDKVGIAKRDNLIEIELLEYCVREDLNKTTERRMAVLDPVKVIIDNYPEEESEELDAENNPEDANSGFRKITFSREIFIERSDFMEEPPKKYFRLAPGKHVRLKHGYIIQCIDFKRDETGTIQEIHCIYFPESKSGSDTSGIKAKGTLHWISKENAVNAEIRLYDRLFTEPEPTAVEDGDFLEFFNKDSFFKMNGALVESGLKLAKPGSRYQFLRQGYFCIDPDSTDEYLVFNRIITLKDTWAKIMSKSQ
jgi:glutaminyl-tRNA synthetase